MCGQNFTTWPDRAGVGALLEQREHWFQPVRQHLGVVVQEAQIAATGEIGGFVAAVYKPLVGIVAHQADAAHEIDVARADIRHVVADVGVVHDDNFDLGHRGVFGDGGEAAERERNLAVGRHDNGYQRLVGQVQDQCPRIDPFKRRHSWHWRHDPAQTAGLTFSFLV